MKKRDLERALTELGWKLDHNGAKHDVWTNGHGAKQAVPRHNEINENTARNILKAAKQSPGEK